MISVIIPIYNEEFILRQNEEYFKNLSKSAELIFVDGGSLDNTFKYAQNLGWVIQSQKNRAVQMNTGAKEARYDILFFLHADTMIDSQGLSMIEEAVYKRGYSGGCFSQVFDQGGIIFKWIAWTGNIRARISKIFYGDQGIFVRKDIFHQLGGYPEIQICEDVFFSKKLKEVGKVGILGCPIHCSARRWIYQGILKTFFLNMRIYWGLAFKQDVHQLIKIYKDIREEEKRLCKT